MWFITIWHFLVIHWLVNQTHLFLVPFLPILESSSLSRNIDNNFPWLQSWIFSTHIRFVSTSFMATCIRRIDDDQLTCFSLRMFIKKQIRLKAYMELSDKAWICLHKLRQRWRWEKSFKEMFWGFDGRNEGLKKNRAEKGWYCSLVREPRWLVSKIRRQGKPSFPKWGHLLVNETWCYLFDK